MSFCLVRFRGSNIRIGRELRAAVARAGLRMDGRGWRFVPQFERSRKFKIGDGLRLISPTDLEGYFRNGVWFSSSMSNVGVICIML